MIILTFQYLCDFCRAEIVGADSFRHGAEFGRYPVPRHITKVASGHACTTCAEVARRETLKAAQERLENEAREIADNAPDQNGSAGLQSSRQRGPAPHDDGGIQAVAGSPTSADEPSGRGDRQEEGQAQ